MFESIGKDSLKPLTDALPGVEKTISDAVAGIQVLVGETIVPIIAEVVTQALAQVDRIDGATVTLKPSGKLIVTVDIPAFTATVSMPLMKTKE